LTTFVAILLTADILSRLKTFLFNNCFCSTWLFTAPLKLC